MLRRLTALCALIVALAATSVAQARAWHLGQYDPGIHNTQNGVYWAFCGHRYVYCGYGDQAWVVSRCESHHYLWAVNGQYLGLFQMGSHERATYGYGNNPWDQARGAANYFYASGRDWSPWSCKPW